MRDRVGDRPLVALGGGRVIDAAKAIAGADDLRCAAVPTTLSGAEMTRIHRMPAGVERFNLMRPSLVIADPALMASQPLPDLAASAMNALAHAVEALYTPFANPVADMAALRAAELIARGLGGDEPSRAELALAGLLAGYASGSAGYAVHHVVGQTLVRLTGAPHARVYAVLLPHTIRLMAGRAPEAIERVAAALGGRLNVSAPPEETIAERAPRRIAGLDPTPADVAAERIAVLAARSGATRLGELGVKPSAAREVAAEAGARPELQNTPDPPHEEELLEYVEAAL